MVPRLFILALLLIATPAHLYAAAGDVVADCQNIASLARMTIKPSSGDEWVLHTVTFERNALLIRTDGTDPASMSAVNWIGPDHFIFNPAIHLTNGNFIEVINQDGSLTSNICFTAIKTKD